DALEGKTLWRVEPVIIGLFEIGYVRQRVAVVLVRRIARPVAARRDDLDHQQALGLGVLRQDVADMTRVGALAAGQRSDLARRDHPRLEPPFSRGRTQRELAVG